MFRKMFKAVDYLINKYRGSIIKGKIKDREGGKTPGVSMHTCSLATISELGEPTSTFSLEAAAIRNICDIISPAVYKGKGRIVW